MLEETFNYLKDLKENKDKCDQLFAKHGIKSFEDLETKLNEYERKADTKYIFVGEKYKKALQEIIALYKEWLAHQKSDYEFFTLLNEIVCKYDLKEVIEK